jgi:hypothetical protein
MDAGHGGRACCAALRGLGVFVAYLIAGRNFGQLPALTVPLCLIASIIFALSRSFTPVMRLTIMLVGTGVFILLGRGL